MLNRGCLLGGGVSCHSTLLYFYRAVVGLRQQAGFKLFAEPTATSANAPGQYGIPSESRITRRTKGLPIAMSLSLRVTRLVGTPISLSKVVIRNGRCVGSRNYHIAVCVEKVGILKIGHNLFKAKLCPQQRKTPALYVLTFGIFSMKTTKPL